MGLKDKKLFLLDMDGTIYLDNDLFDGTLDFLAHVKNKFQIVHAINNPTPKSKYEIPFILSIKIEHTTPQSKYKIPKIKTNACSLASLRVINQNRFHNYSFYDIM